MMTFCTGKGNYWVRLATRRSGDDGRQVCRVINADEAEAAAVCAKSAGHVVSGSRDAVAGGAGFGLAAGVGKVGVGGCDRQRA